MIEKDYRIVEKIHEISEGETASRFHVEKYYLSTWRVVLLLKFKKDWYPAVETHCGYDTCWDDPIIKHDLEDAKEIIVELCKMEFNQRVIGEKLIKEVCCKDLNKEI